MMELLWKFLEGKLILIAIRITEGNELYYQMGKLAVIMWIRKRYDGNAMER